MIPVTRVIIFLFLFAACRGGHAYSYWDISQFRLEPGALSTGQPVHLIYTSRNPDNDRESYSQLVVVSDRTHDTINILSPVDIDLSLQDKDSVFYYYDENDDLTKTADYAFADSLKPGAMPDLRNLPALKRRSKIARDPQFDFVAKNKFPTVIGMIARSAKRLP